MVAGIYDYWYEHPQGRQVFQAEKKAVEQMLPSSGFGIEIGAGTGIFAKILTSETRTILCLDPSVEMLKKAWKRGLPCIVGLGECLPIRCGLLNFCYMVTVLEFLNEPVALFKEFKEVARKDAFLSFLFINSDSSWGELYRNIGAKGDPVFQHAKLYTLDEVRLLLGRAGYIIMDIKGTLNSHPMEQDVDQDLVEPSEKSGVLIVRAVKKGIE